jgi:hypothetical protein
MAHQVMGTQMLSGFTYNTLELSVNKGNFPDIVTNTAESMRQSAIDLRHMLTDAAVTYTKVDVGSPEYHEDGSNLYDADFVP